MAQHKCGIRRKPVGAPTQIHDHTKGDPAIKPSSRRMPQSKQRARQEQHGLDGRDGRLIQSLSQQFSDPTEETFPSGLLIRGVVVHFGPGGEFRDGEEDGVEEEFGKVRPARGHVAGEDYQVGCQWIRPCIMISRDSRGR
jgi:hypothetical protein